MEAEMRKHGFMSENGMDVMLAQLEEEKPYVIKFREPIIPIRFAFLIHQHLNDLYLFTRKAGVELWKFCLSDNQSTRLCDCGEDVARERASVAVANAIWVINGVGGGGEPVHRTSIFFGDKDKGEWKVDGPRTAIMRIAPATVVFHSTLIYLFGGEIPDKLESSIEFCDTASSDGPVFKLCEVKIPVYRYSVGVQRDADTILLLGKGEGQLVMTEFAPTTGKSNHCATHESLGELILGRDHGYATVNKGVWYTTTSDRKWLLCINLHSCALEKYAVEKVIKTAS